MPTPTTPRDDPGAVGVGVFDPAPFSASAAAALRDSLRRADYTVDGVHALLGPAAAAALGRNETTPARVVLDRLSSGGAPAQPALATMVRLWTVQAEVSAKDAATAFGAALDPLADSGILVRHDDTLRAAIDVRPYGDEQHDGWIVSDLTPGLDGSGVRLGDSYVLGVNDAATTLAGLTLRRPVGRALDLGTGSGIQTLHLARHADVVVGTDVNDRALAMARLGAALNGLDVDWRNGSLLGPVTGETFDLVVSNPPFVLSPGVEDVSALTYRDSGTEGDAMVAGLLGGMPGVLAPGGVAHLLANWAHVDGQDWRQRVVGWIGTAVDGGPVDAWVVQREVLDPAAYVELWLRDAGVHGARDYESRYRAWLAWFAAAGITAVGMGWVTLHRPVTPGTAHIRIEDLAGPVAQPLGPAVGRWVDAVEWLRSYPTDGALREARLTVADDVVAEQWTRPGSSDPEHLVLRQQGTTMRAVEVDTALAGFVGACDGDLTAGQIIDALAQLLDVVPEQTAVLERELLGSARDLLVSGLLRPAV